MKNNLGHLHEWLDNYDEVGDVLKPNDQEQVSRLQHLS